MQWCNMKLVAYLESSFSLYISSFTSQKSSDTLPIPMAPHETCTLMICISVLDHDVYLQIVADCHNLLHLPESRPCFLLSM